MGRAGSALGVWLGLALGVVVSSAGPALAANVAVAPVSITLTRDQHSMLLNVANSDTQPVRFSLSTFAWSQSDTGTMQLSPSQDIIFFPVQMTLAPGEARNVRLGTELLPGPLERSYRIFLEELPQPVVSGSSGHALHVHVLSKIGIPIFVAPDKITAQADITGIEAQHSTISFRVENTGTVHLPPGPVTIAADDSADRTVFSTTVNLWYVLAGGARIVKVKVPASACAKVRSVTVSVKVGSAVVTRSQTTPQGACAP